MSRLKELKDFYDRQFELRQEWREPYRSRAEKCLNTARKTGYIALGLGVALWLGEPILNVAGAHEAAGVANDALVGDVAAYMVLNLGCVARLGFLERQNAHHEQQVA